MAEFRMPSLGADMDEGTLLEWLVKPGDEVHKGDIIAVVDTAKSAIEIESFDTGTVERLIVPEGKTVPVGTVLATIVEPAAAVVVSPLVRRLAKRLGVDLTGVRGTGSGGEITQADVRRAAPQPKAPARDTAARRAGHREAPPAAPIPPAPPARPVSPAPPAPPAPRVSPAPPAAASSKATPLARRTAADLGIDLASITSGAPDGVIRESDVQDAARAQRAAPTKMVTETTAPATRTLAMRQAIGKLMSRSKREIPHYYLSSTVDLTVAMSWLHQRNRELPVPDRLVPAALLLKAAALAARQVPEINGYWLDDRFVPGEGIHLGVATSLRGGGLVTPAIHAADTLTTAELMTSLKDMVLRARAGRLRRAELTEATLTVTNLGDQGVESVFGVIYPPQVALVGFGRVIERPVAADGLIGVRPVVICTLSADHRATDGFSGARYLTAIASLLQQPEDL